MTSAEYAHAVALMACYWPRWDPGPDALTAGERLLLDLELAEVLAAIDQLAVDAPDFPPGLGKIRAKVFELFRTDGPPSPDEAWAEVLQAVARWGWCGN